MHSTRATSPCSTKDILSALQQVIDPASGQDIVAQGMISGVTIKGDQVGFLITIDPTQKASHAWLKEACETIVAGLPGVATARAILTAHSNTPIAPTPQGAYPEPRARATWNITPLDGVRQVVAVASGKGGVGKSTVTAHVAMALAARGMRVGVLDADIYGPSMPTMFALSGQPEIKDGRMQPHLAHGVKCMSMGLIMGDEAAILRGPMISKSLQQMLRMTHWATAEAPLDMLLVDMPPGTGDVHLSLAQQIPLKGAILVTTPQAVAVKDAEKCAKMFEKLEIAVLGVVENMSYLEMPDGSRSNPFGSGGGEALARYAHSTLLAHLPLDAAIGEACDAGHNLQPQHPAVAQHFLDLADTITRVVA